LDALGQFREQGRDYFDASTRLAQIQEEGRRRVQQVLSALSQARSVNELNYWKLDYLQQRAWLVKSQAQVCIDLLRNQERLLAACENEAQARRLLSQSDFYLGINILYRMQRRLILHESPETLGDDLLTVTLASMASEPNTTYRSQWAQKQQALIARLKTMRSDLVGLAGNLEKIDIHGGNHETP
jgi:hypothetical protein